MDGVWNPAQHVTSSDHSKGRAVIDIDGFKIDLGTLGGENSWMNWGEINDSRADSGYVRNGCPGPERRRHLRLRHTPHVSPVSLAILSHERSPDAGRK